jgi:hypothetical protein
MSRRVRYPNSGNNGSNTEVTPKESYSAPGPGQTALQANDFLLGTSGVAAFDRRHAFQFFQALTELNLLAAGVSQLLDPLGKSSEVPKAKGFY